MQGLVLKVLRIQTPSSVFLGAGGTQMGSFSSKKWEECSGELEKLEKESEYSGSSDNSKEGNIVTVESKWTKPNIHQT